MTPLIDVVFLLLTFFVMSLVLMVKADLLGVRLPSLSAAAPAERGDVIVIAATAGDDVTVDGAPVEVSDVARVVLEARGRRPEARLLVAVDEGGRNRVLLALLNELAGAGLNDFAIVGRRPSDATPGR